MAVQQQFELIVSQGSALKRVCFQPVERSWLDLLKTISNANYRA